jgi:molybdate transport repressor ModE-like protein
MRFDVTDLRLFTAIVEQGSITNGAAACNLSLASASSRINGMEDVAGIPLLERRHRGVVPTAAGITLLEHARLISLQTDRMRRDLESYSGGLQGDIKMLANTAALVELVPAALKVFLKTQLRVNIDVEERTSVDIVQAVTTGAVEFGIVSSPTDTGILEIRPAGSDRLCVLMPSGHPLADRGIVPFTELLGEPFIGLSAGALSIQMGKHAQKLGSRINYRVRLRSFNDVARMVEAGIGIGVVPWSAARHLRSGTIRLVDLTDSWAFRRLQICALSFEKLSASTRSLVAEIERQATLLDAPRE